MKSISLKTCLQQIDDSKRRGIQWIPKGYDVYPPVIRDGEIRHALDRIRDIASCRKDHDAEHYGRICELADRALKEIS